MKLKVLSFFLLIIMGVCACSGSSDDPIIVEKEPELPIEEEKHEPWTGLQIVMFTPSDVDLPDDYKERMKEVTDYSEWFFQKWMNEWGYTCDNPLKIHKDKDGYPIIWKIKGEQSQASGAYDKLGYADTEVIPAAKKKYNISSENQTWWVFSYPGPSSSAYRGGGTFRSGKCSANFIPNTGQLILPENDELAEGAAAIFKLKAAIHELTHALGITHIGPIHSDKLGNSLMGPTNKTYHKKMDGNENRVYLTKATAALLWKHPLFSGDFNYVITTPTVDMTEYRAEFNSETGVIQITGTLNSNLNAHSVVIANESDSDLSDYWRKTFTGTVNDDGTFSCDISELSQAGGEFIIVFCFDNGAISGSNGRFGVTKGIRKSYVFENNTFKFN